jgi:predicted HTH transcriptional regulator
MPDKNIIDLIIHGSEERNLEYKRSMSWKDNSTKIKVTKTSMAMANIPDGGVMIFGVDEISHRYFEPRGMNTNDANSFTQDDISDYVNGYADPFVELTVERVDYDGKLFVVIQIREFDELPVVCKKDGQDLVRGAIYTRPRHKFESVPVPSQTEMREILEMAIDRRIRKHREDWFRWGLFATPTPEDLDAQKFEEQLGGL